MLSVNKQLFTTENTEYTEKNEGPARGKRLSVSSVFSVVNPGSGAFE